MKKRYFILFFCIFPRLDSPMGNKKFSKPHSFLFLYSITYEKFQIKFSNKNLSSLPVIDYILSLSLLFPFFRFLEKSLELVWTILRKSDGKWSSHFRIEQVNRKSKEKRGKFWLTLLNPVTSLLYETKYAWKMGNWYREKGVLCKTRWCESILRFNVGVAQTIWTIMQIFIVTLITISIINDNVILNYLQSPVRLVWTDSRYYTL